MRLRYMHLYFGILLVLVGCQGRMATQQQEAARQVLAARDFEEDFADLPRAIERYAEIAQKYPDVDGGIRALDRHRKLKNVLQILTEIDSKSKDDQFVAYARICTLVPDYGPALRKLGTLNFNKTYIHSRAAAKLKHEATAEEVLRVWSQQDSLWSGYEFRATALDREWRDRLCSQALEVARMLEAFRRYDEALEIVDRGLDYAVNEDVKAHAKVFAAFYTFRKARFNESIVLAEEGLSYEFLSKEDKSRAYHTIGLCYTYIHEDTGQLSDLDAGIKALNEAVIIDPSNAEAKRMLKALRIQRERLYL